jgi:drug/metabolite transporter (DMT)-like permease
MSKQNQESINDHTAIPGKPDLIRMGIGIIGIGTSGPLIALSTMPVPILIFWRNLGGSILSAPFGLRHAEWRNRDGMKWSSIAGICLALHFLCFFAAMRMTSVAAGTAMVALQPIFAAIFVKFTGGHIPSRAWLGMIVSFLGVLLVTGVDFNISLKSFAGDVIALVSAALAALYMLAGSRAQKEIQTSSYTTVCYFVCAITVLPLALLSGVSIFHFSLQNWLFLAGLILGAQILGHTMFNSALKRVSPAVVSLIIFFEVPVSSILALWWLNQRPAWGVIPGIALIIFGCALLVLRTRPERSELLQ